jgi:glycosyltransferase involved in cell wall biosynthesis
MNELLSCEAVVIAVVVRDRFSMFRQCLEAVYAFTNVPFRVIVIAGAVDTATKAYLQQLESERNNMRIVLLDHLLMQGEARNIALRQVDERFCVVLENDTIVHENWLPPLLECMQDEGAAVVMPLIFWYRGLHAAGCVFEERVEDGAVIFNHKILYTGIRRKRIDFPESHCVLIDRLLLPTPELFDNVEPFDVDLGLTLRKHGVSVFFEPLSVVTYSAPPPLDVSDVPSFKFRWDAKSWEHQNRRFMQKWGVTYNPSSKRRSYRRQQLKLGLASCCPTKLTINMSNVAFSWSNRLLSLRKKKAVSDVESPDDLRQHKGKSIRDASCFKPLSKAGTRVLFVDNQVDDFLRYRIPLVRKLRDAGFDVHVALPLEPGLEDIRGQGIPVHVIYLQRLSTRFLDELRCLRSVRRLYQQLQPTLVHHICLKPTLYGGISARLATVPAVVNTLCGLGYPFTQRTIKMRILRAIIEVGLRFSFGHQNNRTIFQNADDRRYLLAKRILKNECAVLIKGSGVDLSLFTLEPEPKGPCIVLMASRLLWAKGVGEFVAAARALRGRGIRARFVLVGEPDRGHPSAIPESTLKRWCEAGDVEWLGWRDDMAGLIRESHIVCLPSSYCEGVPRILLEAAASGRPIVATDVPGCREIVRNGQNGLLVPLGRREDLIEAIARLIENADLRRAMGLRGREIAVIEFSLERVLEENLTAYSSLLSDFAGNKCYAGPNDHL